MSSNRREDGAGTEEKIRCDRAKEGGVRELKDTAADSDFGGVSVGTVKTPNFVCVVSMGCISKRQWDIG